VVGSDYLKHFREKCPPPRSEDDMKDGPRMRPQSMGRISGGEGGGGWGVWSSCSRSSSMARTAFIGLLLGVALVSGNINLLYCLIILSKISNQSKKAFAKMCLVVAKCHKVNGGANRAGSSCARCGASSCGGATCSSCPAGSSCAH
jgi:hypothetical protein